ncbi:hypothetical protein B0J13DRAFT_538259 [Dactylonectria estremocensis]|uniref:Uncharacterized protein n=1 Tax=Dactylonectria estremocensis TaxID=1079267 RepID=A0A9P9FLV8_9HYPO|nr:hypothetical protein B0J13DRAFT_538259 [Dactylonectria estremocensis]
MVTPSLIGATRAIMSATRMVIAVSQGLLCRHCGTMAHYSQVRCTMTNCDWARQCETECRTSEAHDDGALEV